MPECMSGTLVSCNMFVAAMLDDLCLDPWPGLSDEELTTYLLKEQWGGLARHRRCIFWIFLLIMGAVLIHWRRAHGCQKDRFFVSEKEIINFWSMAPWSEKGWHLSMLWRISNACHLSPRPGVVEVPTASVRSCELGCVCAAGVVRQASGWIDTATGRKKGVKET